jgi:hypothetical protein
MVMTDNAEPEPSSSTTHTPTTPSKRKYPHVGNRLKPGPKPKPTPKKEKKGAKQEPTSGSPIATLPMARAHSMDERKHEFGGPLGTLAVPGPSSQPMTSGSLSHGAMPTGPPPGMPGYQSTPHPIRRTKEEEDQPMLVLAPPAPPGAGSASLLPKEFIDRMYAIVEVTVFDEESGEDRPAGKRFQCLIQGCERHFPRKSAICSHIQTHLDDKPYQCTEEEW